MIPANSSMEVTLRFLAIFARQSINSCTKLPFIGTLTSRVKLQSLVLTSDINMSNITKNNFSSEDYEDKALERIFF